MKIGVKARDSDIRQVIRHSDLKQGYNASNKINILLEDVKKGEKKKSIEELKTEVKIMLSLVRDTEEQLFLQQLYQTNKNKTARLEEMLDSLTNNNFNFLHAD